MFRWAGVCLCRPRCPNAPSVTFSYAWPPIPTAARAQAVPVVGGGTPFYAFSAKDFHNSDGGVLTLRPPSAVQHT
jgi:hypothetical protein